MVLTRLFLLVLLLILVSGCSPPPNALYIGDKETAVFIEAADNFFERSKGLMGRKNLDDNKGMLLIYKNNEILSVWMKNMLIPLDIIFIDKNKRIVDIKENIQPCQKECPIYSSETPAMYVLEVNAGFVERNGIERGDAVKFETIFAKNS